MPPLRRGIEARGHERYRIFRLVTHANGDVVVAPVIAKGA